MEPLDMNSLPWFTCYRHDLVAGELIGEFDVVTDSDMEQKRERLPILNSEILDKLRGHTFDQNYQSEREEDNDFVRLQQWAVREATTNNVALKELFRGAQVVASNTVIAAIANAKKNSTRIQFLAKKIDDIVFLKEEPLDHAREEEQMQQQQTAYANELTNVAEANKTHVVLTKFPVCESGNTLDIVCYSKVNATDEEGRYVYFDSHPLTSDEDFSKKFTCRNWFKLMILGRKAKAVVGCYDKENVVKEVIITALDMTPDTKWLVYDPCEDIQGLAGFLVELNKRLDTVSGKCLRVHNDSSGSIVYFEKLDEMSTDFFTETFKQHFNLPN